MLLPSSSRSGPSVGSSSDDSLSSAEQSQESAEAEAIRKRDARNLQFFRDRIPGIAGNRYRDDDIRKLKLGLQVETRKWRAEAAKLMRTRGQQYSVGVNSNDKPWTDEGTSSRNAVAASDSSSPADDWNNRFRPLAFDPPTEGQGQGVGKGPGAVAGSVSSSESRQRRQHQRASGGRWRASLELIDSARARARGAGVGTEDPDMDADMDADVDEAESVPKRGGTGGSWGGLGESDAASTNYALLIHSCLLLSLSTYNLKVLSQSQRGHKKLHVFPTVLFFVKISGRFATPVFFLDPNLLLVSSSADRRLDRLRLRYRQRESD